jgi:cytidylate kinase
MHNYSDQIKEHEIGRAYSTYKKFMNPRIILVRKPKEKAHLVNLVVGGRII